MLPLSLILYFCFDRTYLPVLNIITATTIFRNKLNHGNSGIVDLKSAVKTWKKNMYVKRI